MFKIFTDDSHLQYSFTAFSMAFSSKADQINWIASLNLETVLALVAACDKTPALPPNLIIQWTEIVWTVDQSSLAMKSWQFDLVKLRTWNGKNDKYSNKN